jgi:acyl-CoA thioester hydrolase
MTGEPDTAGDPRIFWTDDVFRFGDVDANGHINNTAIGALAESGRVRLIESDFAPSLPEGAFFVVARLLLEFRREMHFPGSVRTGTWISRIGRTSLTLRQAVRPASGDDAATAEAVCVLLDGRDRRPVPLPEALREAAARRHVADGRPA